MGEWSYTPSVLDRSQWAACHPTTIRICTICKVSDHPDHTTIIQDDQITTIRCIITV